MVAGRPDAGEVTLPSVRRDHRPRSTRPRDAPRSATFGPHDLTPEQSEKGPSDRTRTGNLCGILRCNCGAKDLRKSLSRRRRTWPSPSQLASFQNLEPWTESATLHTIVGPFDGKEASMPRMNESRTRFRFTQTKLKEHPPNSRDSRSGMLELSDSEVNRYPFSLKPRLPVRQKSRQTSYDPLHACKVC